MKWRRFLLGLFLLTSGPLLGVRDVSAASRTTPKIGTACKVAGQVSSAPPAQLICQRSPKKQLVWTRVLSSPLGSAPANTSSDIPGSTAPTGGASQSNPAKFLSRPSPTSALAAATLFNEQGKNGYAHIGPFFVGGSSHEIFVKTEVDTTYAYDVVEKTSDASTPVGLVALLTSKGKDGYLFKAPAFFGTDFTKSYVVFVKSNSKKTTYSYRSSAWPTDEPTMLSDLNTNGAAGFAYVSDVIPDLVQSSVGVRLFVKDNTATTTFSYSTKPQLADRAQLLAEIVAAGSEKAIWKGGYVFGVGTPAMQTRTLYEKSSSTPKATSCSFVTPVPATIDALIGAANENATRGELFWGQYQVGSEIVSVYCNAPLTTLPLVGAVLP